MNKNILVTGLAGSGKSTLRDVFAELGYESHGIDEDGLASWQHQETHEEVLYTGHEPAMWHDIHHWMLRREALDAALKSPTPDRKMRLFFGFTADIAENFASFDRVFLLEYPDDATVRNRAANRPDPNAYGKQPIELARIIADRIPFQEKARRLGATGLRCTAPIDETVAQIELANR